MRIKILKAFAPLHLEVYRVYATLLEIAASFLLAKSVLSIMLPKEITKYKITDLSAQA